MSRIEIALQSIKGQALITRYGLDRARVHIITAMCPSDFDLTENEVLCKQPTDNPERCGICWNEEGKSCI